MEDWRVLTHWLFLDVVEGIRCSIDNLALNLVCPTTVISQAASAHADVDLGHGDGLAVVQGLNSREQIEVLLEQVGKLDQQLTTVLWSLLPPWAFEGLAGCCDCDVDILLGGLVYGGNDLFIRWVDDLEGLSVYTFDEFIVDEAVWDPRSVICPPQSCRQPERGRGKAYSPVGCSYLPVWGVSSCTDVMIAIM